MRLLFTVAVALTSILLSTFTAFGRAAIDPRGYKDYGDGSSAVGPPAFGIAGHRVGQIVLGVNNNGTFGTGFTVGASQDYFTGQAVPSCEYPKNSNVDYLFAASFWVGAIVGRDTLVSVGADGWQLTREMFPDEAPFGEMVKRSIIDPTQPEYEGAISEEDFICVYSDTYTQGIAQDAFDGRPHRPLHIESREASYAWSYSYAQDIILFDYKIRNMGFQKLENVYMGIYVDADVCFDCQNTNGFADDICGFLETYPAFCENCEYTDTVNIAWISDNDGDFNRLVPAPHVTATRIVRTPAEKLDVSFNWWISNGNSSLDFGPRERSETGRWKERFRDFRTGGLGTPEGDANKYYVLRNREFDYDQVFTASISESDTLWLPPGAQAGDYTDGFDTRYLLSFGPFNISPGEELPISFAYMAGADFHRTLDNLDNLPDDPSLFYDNLNFTTLAANSRWASWIYDNPGVDTDSNGYYGEIFVCVAESTIVDSSVIPGTDPPQWEYEWEPTLADTCWIIGDGVPDFRGASPPPAPRMWVTPEVGKLHIRFNGLRSETTKDVFSGTMDFEGYRVYISRDDRSESYSIVASYDREDYNKWIWNPARPGGAGYQLLDDPYTREQLQCAYGDSCGGDNFDPLVYTRSSPYVHPTTDSLFYFEPQDYNVSELGVTTKITRLYPDQEYPSTLIPEEADPTELTPDGYLKYFEYALVIEDLLPTVQYWVNVTAFDYGSPSSGLASLETSVTVGSVIAYPLSSVEEVQRNNLEVFIYPNPYRLDAAYSQSGFEEAPSNTRSEDRLRQVHFANLPATCTIRIFSLDGDLVRQIGHRVPVTDPTASHDTWDLITRNTQLAVSGIYYWTVEDENGDVQIGKLVLIM
ncbi:MAG: hypothetical protein OEW00_03935 [candidate division Zixibacteria bacterium]|nr:hypothetical protein [candidate division Zixibacteria bacterium]